MKQKLVIELSEEATEKYLKHMTFLSEYSAEYHCLFPGFYLQIDYIPGLEEVISIKEGDELKELGDVTLNLININK